MVIELYDEVDLNNSAVFRAGSSDLPVLRSAVAHASKFLL